MARRSQYDAIVIGSGPNGLAAAIKMAQAGRSVMVYEAKETIGGGCRSAELTLPGFVHDICSAVHPLGIGSPFFQSIPLADYGLTWISSPVALAHPFDDGGAVLLQRSIEDTAAGLGSDARAYTRLMQPLVANWQKMVPSILGPLRIPAHPLALIRFGLPALLPARVLAERAFKGERARALFAGLAAHSIQPLEHPLTAAFGLVLGILAHAVGWPIPRGGSHVIVDAMADYLRSLGGEIITGLEVKSLDMLPPTSAYLCDITPRQLLRIAGNRLPRLYQQELAHYRYGPGVFKVDYALDGPIPWKAQECLQAITVHIGGTMEEICASESTVGHGEHPERPFVLVAQQSLFDPTRAPNGKHTAWTYCHVPNGSTYDMTERIEAQIERFAPGFRDRILARSVTNALEYETYNPNYIGGDINGGIQNIAQLFTRPAIRLNPYTTPAKGVYICSSSTPPGGGVHGMCGYWAAQSALRAKG
ncbi:MAG TPA: NAD(P)/FAD-dependent oxidoreductase [Ktedonobacteraceae bacterium]|jgi:phytoene dehydrogenase-like protein|nr:NAD(P)/FAD-dependent oxidoreductase [Ktedonobacteraceae bacterium]